MSRIGKQPVPVPDGVKVEIKDKTVTVTGPKGSLSRPFVPQVEAETDGRTVTVTKTDSSREAGAFQGLFRTLINNMVLGVSQGYSKKLELVGVGYRAEVQGKILNLSLGFSHPVNFQLPEGITAEADRQKVTISGIDKELVGQTAATIRALRPPEPYKGKGVKYADEVIRRKAGKAGAVG